MSGQGT
jgi:hypothetical protein